MAGEQEACPAAFGFGSAPSFCNSMTGLEFQLPRLSARAAKFGIGSVAPVPADKGKKTR